MIPDCMARLVTVKYTDMVAQTTQGCTTRNTVGYNYMVVLLLSIGRAMVACIKINWYNISMNNHSEQSVPLDSNLRVTAMKVH